MRFTVQIRDIAVGGCEECVQEINFSKITKHELDILLQLCAKSGSYELLIYEFFES